MQTELLIYDVKPNDTLDSIAQKIGMNGDELRDFHNANCQEFGLMIFNSLTGIQKIVIPKIYKSEEQIRKEIMDSVPPRQIFPGFFANRYQITESYESDFENKLEISYKVNIQLKENTTAENFVATVNIDDFRKNGEKPDDKMSELSIACAKSIAPLEFFISNEGQIVGIKDFENLKKTFEEKRKDLEDYFIGEVALRYMDKFSESLSGSDYFQKQIDSTLLYQVLFPKMEWFYKQKSWKEKFYMVKNSFPTNFIFDVNFETSDPEEVFTDLRGEIAENLSLQEILQGKKVNIEAEEPCVGLVELKYKTHKENKQLLTAEGGIAVLKDGEIYRKQKILLSKINK